jgi:bacteriocin biosynthesis cyclodehydratase domain-containing protein
MVIAVHGRTVKRPRLKRSIDSVKTPDGDVVLIRPAADDIRIAAPSDADRELLRALDGTRTVAQLRDRFGAAVVDETLAGMQALFLLEDAAEDDQMPVGLRERFDRQLRYFSEIGGDGPSPTQAQQRLRDGVVAVLGVGGLGGRVALELACCGVGELRLFDGDRVETSNLDRQIQFTEADVGKRKVEIMAKRLRAFNSDVLVRSTAQRIESKEAVAECIGGADLVVDAADWPPYEFEHWCNAACWETGTPYIAMSQLPPLVRVGPLYVPGETGCYGCQDIRYRREYPLYETAIDQLRGRESPAPSLGPPCGVIGGMVAMDVVHFLTGLASPATFGVGYTIDLRTMAMEREEIVAEPDCPVCGGSPEGAPG